MHISPQFTPWLSLTGGILIGLAAAAVLLLYGKICGISGIVSGGILSPSKGDTSWRILFTLGLIVGGFIMVLYMPRHTAMASAPSPIIAIIAGLLVGFGTRLGSGCTSGHGVCGIPRRSPRSIIATITFILSGIVTVYFMKNVL